MSGQAARDPRLDFFRGLGMFIILIAHIPWNSWTDWIPARFGFSDGADLFVFCSGLASSLAFAPIFERRGWFVGVARILHRMWQVYWAHIGGFLVVLAIVAAADAHFGGGRYSQELMLGDFFTRFQVYAPGLMTLRFVPNYFDILPMYIAILGMIPIAMALASISRGLVAIAVIASWFATNAGFLTVQADPLSGRDWFFDPFGWQLVFFTGFAFGKGWLSPPPPDRRLIIAAVALIVLAAPVSCQNGFGCYAGFGYFPTLGALHDWLGPVIDKTHIGMLRYVHFLATAYLAYLAAGPRGANLRGPIAAAVGRVGQQTLAVFLTGLVGGHVLGIALDVLGRNAMTTAFVNLIGAASLIVAAAVVAWVKSAPWKGGRPNASLAPREARQPNGMSSAEGQLVGSNA
ncbi:MAG: OpgC domain-containing protein [Hyphomicrobiales bacterium]|nr:OpgC domain-containing protein [Hyphomicrobiales bacterium]